MIGLDPSPWLLLTVPFVAVIVYITRRGLLKNEFRVPGRDGWATYSAWSFSWWSATVLNFTFLAASLFILYQSLMRGSEFSREPNLPMPSATGVVIKTANVERSPDSLARCLANLDNGESYELGQGGRRVAVRNGRNDVMYIFEITPYLGGSHLEVNLVLPSPFVTWSRCFDPNDDGSIASSPRRNHVQK